MDPLTSGLNLLNTVIDRVFPDKEKADAAKLEVLKMQQSGELAELQANAGIVQAEIASNSWLGKNWRPLVMLILVGMSVARWFGWSATNLQPSEYTQLWQLVQIGVGGYLGARTVEKVVPAVVGAVTGAKSGS